MKEFWVRMVSVLIVTGLIFGYNSVLEARAKEEQIAKLNAELAGGKSDGQADSSGEKYKNGTYTGEADGFGGIIEVEVKVEKHKITEVNIVSAEGEDGSYLAMAKDIIPKIVEAQNTDVDTISGATFSSTGIKNASKEALEKAVE